MAHTLLVGVDEISGKAFDYVIIGGGTAGVVLASRLSEDPNVTVAVLEAGKAHINDPKIMAPAGWTSQIMRPEYDWVFKTVHKPDTNDGLGTVWNRGKSLGGSSALNFLTWNRPQREDIEAIGKLGNKGWSWDLFYKYAKRTEKFTPPSHPDKTGYRDLWNDGSIGRDGPVPVSFPVSSGVEAYWQQSLKANGVNILDDAMSGQTAGTWKSVAIVDPVKGTRSYATPSYLDPAAGRRNLKILTEAYVTKIITLDDVSSGVKATGVQFEYGGQVHEVQTRREVLVCAGAIKSPQIMELSGIGDRAILEPLGIPVKHHLPSVGTNVQEHPVHGVHYYKLRDGPGFLTGDRLNDPDEAQKLLARYPIIDKQLALAFSAVTFLPIHSFSDRAEDLIAERAEILAKNAHKYRPGLKEQYELQLEMMKSKRVPDCELVLLPFNAVSNDPDLSSVCMVSVLAHPWSRGTIHVRSSDPKEPPAIDPGYFEEETDLKVLMDMFKFKRKVIETEPMSQFVEKELMPGSSVSTDKEIEEHARKVVGTCWHTCGSMSMLPEEKDGVVNNRFQVYGTQNIRVVDLSVLPMQISVHTQATVYALAEMASDIIKGKLKL